MCNSEIIYQNNLAVDCLHAGDVENGLKILSRAFFDSVRDRHQRHGQRHYYARRFDDATTVTGRVGGCGRSTNRRPLPQRRNASQWMPAMTLSVSSG